MNNKSLYWGIGITLAWLIIIFLFGFMGGMQAPTSFNELGDALAGIFAPIAFFWLIMGYIQQGKQLDQNTKALEQQEKALQLQIEEMKESVKQQEELAKIQKQQMTSTYRMVRPALRIWDGYIIRQTNKEFFLLHAELENIGLGIAQNIYLNIDLENGRSHIRSFDYKDQDLEKYNLEKNERIAFKCYLSKDDFLDIDSKHMWLKLSVEYEDVYKNKYIEEFMAGIDATEDENKYLVYF